LDQATWPITYTHIVVQFARDQIAKDSKKDIIRKPKYHSLFVGLVFNGVAVLGLAAEGTDQVTIQGDVELQVQPLLSHR